MCLSSFPAFGAEEYAGSAACARCHAEVFSRYSRTPMARSSGPVSEAPAGDFTHPRSGIQFRVSGSDLTFSGEGFSGSRALEFFVGSGSAARSFLWRRDGFLFEAPITWYRAARKWDASPGYEAAEMLRLTRPIEPECLNCHATLTQPLAGTQNGYASEPFLEGGIGCERWHGPGRDHSKIVNRAKLPPQRRDSICAQCHLIGVERVERSDRSVAEYRPGAVLADFAISFVHSGTADGPVHVASHYERLEQSRCKVESGDRLWCGSCHDPHAAKAIDYSAKCLNCHAQSEHARARSAGCIACHMPSIVTADAPHTVITDHSIPRNPGLPKSGRPGELKPFWGEARDRELGLAWARLAHRTQRPSDFARAFELLQRARANDAQFLTQMANLYEHFGDETKANEFYKRSYAKDSSQAEVAVNLGAMAVKEKSIGEAIRLWKEALHCNPGLEEAAVKLALAYLATGQSDEARKILTVSLDYNPDSPLMRKLMAELGESPKRPPR